MRYAVVVISSVLLIGLVIRCDLNKKMAEEKRDRPNVLFLFADDQTAEALGCSGNSYINTPNIDLLARNGVRFTNTYVMGGHIRAICAPSRAMLMSGKYLFMFTMT